MKKILKAVFAVIGVLLVVLLSAVLCINASVADVRLDKSKLINPQRTINFYDTFGNLISEESNGVSVTGIKDIPEHTQKAFISIEDKRFYSHKGVDYRGLLRATFNNLKSMSFKEGGSTITQQLIKNTHLSNEKTLKRKLAEIKLARILEKSYTKDEILEKYLNTIYFGDNCYGITSAAEHYFNKSPERLDINESAALAGMVKAPSYYSPFADSEKCNVRKNLVLKEMFSQKYITEHEYSKYKNLPIETCKKTVSTKYDYTYLAKQEFNSLISSSPYENGNVEIYTTYNPVYQKIIETTLQDFTDVKCEKSVVLMDKNASVLSYFSTCGDNYRQVGSVIKPIAVYAPAIQNNVVNSYTILTDEKTDFSGYSPSNYNDVYRGDISVKDSLSYSSNVCAVKLLNYVGVENSVKLLKQTGFQISDGDKSLTLALGASQKGAKLTQVTSSYNIFSNSGYYNSPSCVTSFKTKNGTLLYKKNNTKRAVIGDDTAYIVSDMLRNTVLNGTAKKLSFVGGTLYGKTGTVGNKNGNTDAYIISFDSQYTLGVWCGNPDGELLNNSITGGTTPSIIAEEIWDKIYDTKIVPPPIEKPESVLETYIDKLSYDNENQVVLADDNAPDRYKLKAIFKGSALPKLKSTRFTKPKIDNYETTVINNSISIKLCQTEYCNAKIFKVVNGEKNLIFDSISGNVFNDKNLKYNCEYQYVILPYCTVDGKTFYGDEVVLDKIKTPNGEFGEDWWQNAFE